MTAEQLAKDTDDVTAWIGELLGGIDGVQRTIIANRLRRAIDEVSPPKVTTEVKPQPVEPMETNEAFHMASEKIEYGQYAGQCWGDIPRSYLDWLVEAKRTEWRRLASFLRSPVAPERDHEDDDE